MENIVSRLDSVVSDAQAELISVSRENDTFRDILFGNPEEDSLFERLLDVAYALKDNSISQSDDLEPYEAYELACNQIASEVSERMAGVYESLKDIHNLQAMSAA